MSAWYVIGAQQSYLLLNLHYIINIPIHMAYLNTQELLSTLLLNKWVVRGCIVNPLLYSPSYLTWLLIGHIDIEEEFNDVGDNSCPPVDDKHDCTAQNSSKKWYPHVVNPICRSPSWKKKKIYVHKKIFYTITIMPLYLIRIQGTCFFPA